MAARKTKKVTTAPTAKTTQSVRMSKSTVKKNVVTSTPIAKKAVPPKSVKASSKEQQKLDSSSAPLGIRVKRSYIITLLVVILVASLLVAFRGLFVAAMVNGQPVSRLAVIQELERQGGQQALNSLVTRTLIEQEARRQNITASAKEIEEQMRKIESNLKKQNQSLDQVLAMQGMTKEQLRDQIRLQILIEKMVGKDIKITDQEINEYLEKNKDFIPAGTKPEDAKQQARDQLYQQKINAKVRPWIDELHKKAKINYFVQY